MRNLINIISLTENFTANPEEIEAFKSVIASKIKTLPDDDATAKTLKEIEELLQHVGAGGRMGMIRDQLVSINDPAVSAFQKRLAQYIAGMEVDPADRAELFRMWKSDKIVNIDKLLSKKSQSFDEIFNGYSTNPAIKELVDDVMVEQALGQGKGEFGLNVLSKSVSKPGKHYDVDADGDKEAKGDLLMKHNSKWRKIEVKTTHGGGARFSDQEVRPAEGYEQARVNVEKFISNVLVTQPEAKKFFGRTGGKIGTYGVNLDQAIQVLKILAPAEQTKLFQLLNTVILTIFGGSNANKADVSAVMSAVKAQDADAAKQAYSQASFNYYMGKKDDDGVLAIDLNRKTFMFYSEAADLKNEALRFHADTIYLTAKDVQRGAYPQLKVQPTTFGANARAEVEKQAQQAATKAAKAAPVDAPAMDQDPSNAAQRKQLEDRVFAFVTNQANIKGIFDQAIVDEVSMQTMDMLLQGIPTDQIKKQVNAMLTQKKAQPQQVQPAQPQQAQTPVAEAKLFGRRRRA